MSISEVERDVLNGFLENGLWGEFVMQDYILLVNKSKDIINQNST